MTSAEQPPEGMETKNLPAGYVAAPVPVADTLGHYSQTTDTIVHPPVESDQDNNADNGDSTGDDGTADAGQDSTDQNSGDSNAEAGSQGDDIAENTEAGQQADGGQHEAPPAPDAPAES